MLDSLSIGATSMQAQQLNVDTIANNLANVNTPGFKRARVSFTDLMTREAARVPGTLAAETTLEAGPLAAVPRLGAGVGVANVAKVFEPGAMKQTGGALDVAIQGEGFLEVSMPDGSRAFTRGGTLQVNADGALAAQGGRPLRPGISIPAQATSVTITSDGRVLVALPGRSEPAEVGQLELARFPNPMLLQAQGDSLYRATDGSGEPVEGKPGSDGLGTVAQGFLEGSNVKMVDEMVNLMIAQRAYEASVKVVQASDEMLGLVNNLRK